jgi:hypothetical protein
VSTLRIPRDARLLAEAEATVLLTRFAAANHIPMTAQRAKTLAAELMQVAFNAVKDMPK